MDCSRRRTLELGLGAVGSLTLLAGCSDEGPGNESENNESEGGEGNETGSNDSDEQADHPDEVGEDMEEEGEPTGYAPEANESDGGNESNGTAGPESDDEGN